MAVPAYKDEYYQTETELSSAPGTAGAEKPCSSLRYYPLPWMVAMICDLSSGAKGLFAKLIFDAWGSNCCRVGVRLQANSLGVDRRTIRRWLGELKRRGLIKMEYEWSCCRYYLNPKYRVGGSIPLLNETMKRKDAGWAYKLVMCSLSYKQADKDFCWIKQKALAEELGLSMRTIQRVLVEMKAKGEVQIRLRRQNSKQGNKYALTCGAVLGGRVFGANSQTTESPPLNKKWKAKRSFKALRAKILSGDLSESGLGDGFGPEAVRIKLRGCGIHEKVARPMAFDQRHPYESVDQVIKNCMMLRAWQQQESRRLGLPPPKFNPAGYVVRALNGAKSEGKIVGTTRLFRQATAMSRAAKAAKAEAADWQPPSDEKFERRRQMLLDQLRAIQNEHRGTSINKGPETDNRDRANL